MTQISRPSQKPVEKNTDGSVKDTAGFIYNCIVLSGMTLKITEMKYSDNHLKPPVLQQTLK